MLIDEAAIRRAAGNPNGIVELGMPRHREIEAIPDPKELLRQLLQTASELTGRRLKKFTASARAHRVAELIEDWRPLRKLPAFVQFEEELDQILAEVAKRIQ